MGKQVKFSPIKAPGGKYKQADWILERVPPHNHWVEVFCYSAIVTFTKSPSKLETINDINGDLINFFRVYQKEGPNFITERLKYGLCSRAAFNEYKSIRDNPESSDRERAFAYWYTNRNSINGMGVAWSYGVKKKQSTNSTRFDANRMSEKLELLYGRLSKVQVECLPYYEIIKRYGVYPDVFMYLDPPYFVATNNKSAYYKKEHSFTPEDHLRLSELLKSTQAKWLLSYDDLPEVRELYADFPIEVYKYISTMNTAVAKRRVHSELLISNYDVHEKENLPLFNK